MKEICKHVFIVPGEPNFKYWKMLLSHHDNESIKSINVTQICDTCKKREDVSLYQVLKKNNFL